MSNRELDCECPICFKKFSSSVIASHASNCVTKSSFEEDAASKKRPSPASPSTHPFFSSKKTKVDIPSTVEKTDLKLNASTGLKIEKKRNVPLAEAMRPKSLEEYFGQEEFAGTKDGFWRSVIKSGKIPSMILWGPPGCGKTSLANIIAARCRSEPDKFRFVSLSACTAGVSDVKEAVSKAKNEISLVGRQTILFIDEVHRFNKLQQDAFLPHVENGTISLIGATTENPSFSLNSALLSRCRVVVLKKLPSEAVKKILSRALDSKKVFIRKNLSEHCDDDHATAIIDESAVDYLANICDGDARTALNCLEIALSKVDSEESVQNGDHGSKIPVVNLELIKAGLRRAHVLYDRKGDEHYHCASALQKSIRVSNDNAALYWTMRMLEGGEDPLFIARRFVRIASEDVGLGDPTALGLAVSAMQGCQLIGKPECNVILAQCAVYLARAKKSHEVYHAMNNVSQMIRNSEGNLPPVPLHLRNASSKLGRNLNYGQGYSYDLSKVQQIQYMPEGMENLDFFQN